MTKISRFIKDVVKNDWVLIQFLRKKTIKYYVDQGILVDSIERKILVNHCKKTSSLQGKMPKNEQIFKGAKLISELEIIEHKQKAQQNKNIKERLSKRVEEKIVHEDSDDNREEEMRELE